MMSKEIIHPLIQKQFDDDSIRNNIPSKYSLNSFHCIPSILPAGVSITLTLNLLSLIFTFISLDKYKYGTKEICWRFSEKW